MNRYVFHQLVPAFVTKQSIFYIIFAAVGFVKDLPIKNPQESKENILTEFLKYCPTFQFVANSGQTPCVTAVRRRNINYHYFILHMGDDLHGQHSLNSVSGKHFGTGDPAGSPTGSKIVTIDDKLSEGYIIGCECEAYFIVPRLGVSVECPHCGRTELPGPMLMTWTLTVNPRSLCGAAD